MIEDKSQAMADSIMNWMKGVWELAEPTRRHYPDYGMKG